MSQAASVSTSGAYSVHPHPNFEDSYKRLKKAYLKKGGRQLDKLEGEVASGLRALGVNPRFPGAFERYQLPAKSPREGIEFWRWVFDLPGMTGGSRCGRLLYAIVEERRLVRPFWIYNHDQFAKRPPDDRIRKYLWEIANRR